MPLYSVDDDLQQADLNQNNADAGERAADL